MDIVNKTAMNIVEHVSLLHVRESSEYVQRCGIVESSGSTMSSFLGIHPIVFQCFYQLATPAAKKEHSSLS